MPKLLVILSLILSIFVFSSCGKKGKLYLPEDVEINNEEQS
ncbi:MAG: putative small lipoprotein YifL [Lentimonas sp.]|jgi:predicted small lipoprotein YifL